MPLDLAVNLPIRELQRLFTEERGRYGRGHSVALARGTKTNAKGIVTKANRPRALRAKPKRAARGRGLFKRPTKKRYPIELLGGAHDGTICVDSSFDFDEIAARSFRRNFPRRFTEALKRARASPK